MPPRSLILACLCCGIHAHYALRTAQAKLALEATRTALKKGKGQYILGDAFSYADIVMVVALQAIKRVGAPYQE